MLTAFPYVGPVILNYVVSLDNYVTSIDPPNLYTFKPSIKYVCIRVEDLSTHSYIYFQPLCADAKDSVNRGTNLVLLLRSLRCNLIENASIIHSSDVILFHAAIFRPEEDVSGTP
jgi:hypothetical protein